MATVIGGADTGLLDSSLYLLNRNDATREGPDTHDEQIYVNVSNGNLIVRHVDAYLPSQGEDYALVRTYNSRGNWNGNVGQGWSVNSIVLELSQITSNRITLVNPDTSRFAFTKDATGTYRSVDGAGAYETITQDPVTKYWILVQSDQTRLTFDNNGDLIKSQDTNGNTITYVRRSGKLQQVKDDTGHTITYNYSGSDLASIVDETGAVLASYQYSQGLLLTSTDRAGHVTRYTYNTDGTLYYITFPQSGGEALRQIAFYYSPDSSVTTGKTQLLSWIRDAEGNYTSFAYAFRRDNYNQYTGGITRMVDALGVNRTQSNAAEYVEWRVANGYYAAWDQNLYNTSPSYKAQADEIWLNHATTYTYDQNGQIGSVTQKKTFGGAVSYDYKTEYTYDALENLTSITDANGYAITHSDDVYWRDLRKDYGYVNPLTGQGKLIAELTAAELAALKERYTSHFEYDSRGNLITRLDAEDNRTTYTYTSFNKLATQTSAMGHALVSSDDAFYQSKRAELGYAALVASLSAADKTALLALHTTTYSYDARQNLIEIKSPGGDLTRFTYDVYGNLTRKTVYLDPANLTDPAKQQVTQYVYDAYGNNVKTVDAEGAITYAAYDHFGNRTSFTDGNGGVTRYIYDNDNRLINITDPEGHVTVYTYDSVGNRIAVKDANGHTVVYVYDKNNMLLTVSDPAADPAQTRTTRYSYDVVGDRTSVTDAEGRTRTYVYREDRRLVEVVTPQVADSAGNPTQYHTTYQYDGVGNRISVKDNNGNTTQYVYNPNNLTKQVTDAIGNVTQYRYDANLNQVSIVIGAQLAEADRRVLKFSYDEEDQAIAQVDALGHTTRYAYDAPGNRVAVTDANGNTTDFSYDRNNRLLRETRPAVTDPATGNPVRYTVTHQYDANGNELATTDENGHTTRFSFDRDDRLVLITDANGNQIAYSYDSRHNRTSVQIGVTAHVDAATRHVVVDSTANAQVTTYTYNEFNEIVAKTDGVGNALATSDSSYYQGLRTSLGYAALVANLSAADQNALKNLYTERYSYDRVGNRTATTDNNAHATAFAYDSLNRLTARTDALGHATAYTYDGNGNRRSVTDANGHSTTFTYDAVNRLTDTTDALGVVTHRSYDNVGNLLNETRAAGTDAARTASYIYDLNNRLLSQTDPEGHPVAYEYDAVGNRLKVTDALGHTTRYVYDALNRTVKIIDPLDFETKFEYDGAGNRLTLVDANGGFTRFTYDAGNRRIETTDAEGRVTHFTYDQRNNRITQTSAYGTPEAETTTYRYDAENNLVAVVNAEGHTTTQGYDRVYNRTSTTDGNGHTTTYAFDAVNRQIRVTDALGHTTAYTYDAVGNRLTQTDALNRVTSFVYDELNQLISQFAADGVETRYAYDRVGNRVSLTAAANTPQAATTTFVYNRDDLLIEQTDPLGHTTTYGYDDNHNRTTVTDAGGHTTIYAYDANNRATHITDPLGYTVEYRYDGNGNRVQVIDARGYTSTTYYNHNNEVALTVDNEGYAVGFEYDRNGNVTAQTLYAQKLTRPVDPALVPVPTPGPMDRTTRFEYDQVNRLVAKIDAEGYRSENGYDAVGNRTETRLYRAAGEVAITRSYYDEVNRLASSLTAEGYLTEHVYDAVGNRVRTTRYDERVIPPVTGRPMPALGDVGHTTTYTHDAVNRLVRETNALGIDTSYQYDARGNRVAQVDAAGTPDARVTRYVHDAADRLTDTINANGVVTHMDLDADGNVLARYDGYGRSDQRITTFVYDGNHRVVQQTSPVGVVTYSGYDAAGNRAYQTVWDGTDYRYEVYSYDRNNRLVSSYNAAGEQTAYEYDAAGNRTRLTQAPGRPEERSNTFEYDRTNREVATIDAMGVRTEYRYDGAGNKIETIQAAGTPGEERHTYYVYDLDNRVTQVTDPMGGVTHYEYDTLANQTVIVNANGGVQQNTFDKLGRVIESLSPGGALTRNVYDNRGNVIRTTQSWADGSDSRISTYGYDFLDRQVRVTDPEGFSTGIEYDAFGNQVYVAHGSYLVDPSSPDFDPAKAARAFVVINRFSYDGANRMLSITDGVGTITAYTYDGFGNRLSTTETANTSVPRTTTYRYDHANRLKESRTPEGGIARYDYDGVGNRIAEQLLQSGDEATGVWISRTFEYDKNGRVTTEIDPYGVRTERDYDALGNMLRQTFADGTGDARTVRMEYDLNNRKSADIDALGNRTEYRYDSLGNRIKVTDAQGRVAHYYYNGASKLATVLDPESYINTFQYDSAGNQIDAHVYMTPYTGLVDDHVSPVPTPAAGDRMTHVTYNGINKEAERIEADGSTTRKEYDGAGNLVRETLYANTTSPRMRLYAYDSNNRSTEFTDVDGTITTFGYDAANNRTSETIYSATDPNHSRTTLYEYDLNNRKIRDLFDPAGLNIAQTTSYDRLGNVVRKTDGNGNALTYVYDLNNRVLSETNDLGETTGYVYDRVGNLIRRTDARGYSTDLIYDGNNRVIEEIGAEVEVYTLDGVPANVRPTIIHRYDAAGNEIQTVDANGNATTRYYDGNNRLAAELSGDNVLRVYSYNATGDQLAETLYMTRLGAADHNPDVRPLPPTGEARIITREYDQAGRPTRVVYPRIAVTTLSGTETGNPVATTVFMNPVERNEYDAFGNRIAAYDKNGNRTLAYYDVKGRQVAVVDALGYVTEFDFDAQDNVLEQRVYTQPLDVTVLAPGVRPTTPSGEVYVTSRDYDAASRVIEERAAAIEVFDPATGLSSTVRPTTAYRYDQVGNQLTKTLAAGTGQAITEYSYYNAANRRIAVINAGRVLNVYQYDSNGNLTYQKRFINPVANGVDLFTLNGSTDFMSLVVADANKDEATTFTIDAGNRRTSETDLMGPGTADDLTKSYKYDTVGQRTWLRDEDGYVSQTAYDAAARVLKTVSGDGSGTLFEYDAAGNQIYAYTGEIANNTAPATNIQTTLSSDLTVAWEVNGPQGTRSWVAYDTSSHADLVSYANRSAIQTTWADTTAQVQLPAGTPGTSLYFRVVTQDAAGNQSWTAEQVVTFPPRFSAVAVAQPAADTLEVSVRFDAGASDPLLYYGLSGNTTSSVPFVLQADGSYKATLTGVTNAQDLAFRLGWADSAGHTYSSAEQAFEYRADQVGVSSSVAQGTVTDGSSTQYKIHVDTRLASAQAAHYAVIQAQWRQQGSTSGYAATAAEGVPSTSGYTTYSLVLGDTTLLAAGTYDVILTGIGADGTVTTLDTFSYTVGDTATPATFQSLSWLAPPAGSSQLVIVDGRQYASTRTEGRVLVDSSLDVAGTVPYTAYYTDTFADAHTLDMTSTAVTEQVPDPTDPNAPPITVIVGYDLGVTANFSAAEVANVATGPYLAWRTAGSSADFAHDSLMTSSGTDSFSTTLARMDAGEYELKLYYYDAQGREVIVDWGVVVSTATASETFTGTSQTVVAQETGGSIARDGNGVLSLDPGLYTGALDSDRLQTALTLTPELTGNPGGTADADGRTTGYYAETQFNALNIKIATNENDGLWRTFGVDANGNAVETRLYGDRTATDYIASYTDYDARNRKVVDCGAPAQTASGFVRPVTRYAYNVLDKITEQTDALGQTHRYAYNALGTVIADTDANGYTETTRIDIFGDTTATISRLGHANYKLYDTLGRMVEERDATSRSNYYGYDAFDRRTTMTDGNGNTAHYAYDQRDRMTRLTTPLGLDTVYGYDGRNNRTTTTDARGYTIGEDYDALGRVWRTTSVQGGESIYEYRGYDAYGNLVSEVDGEGRIKSYIYAGFSRLNETIDEDGNRFINTYDRYGRVVQETSPQTQKNITRSYDDAGKLLSVTDYATGVSTGYVYDLLGHRLNEAVTTPGNAHNRSYSYAYNAIGEMTRWVDSATGLQLNLQYDAEGNLARAYTDRGYDPMGQNVDPDTGLPANANYRYINHVYTYDAARRLTKLVQENIDSSGIRTEDPISAYSYDAAGNRVTWNNKGIVVSYTYDADRRVTQGSWMQDTTSNLQTWAYDANGNVLAYRTFVNGSEKTYSVNTFNELNRNTYTTSKGDDGSVQNTTRYYDKSGRATQMVLQQGGKTYYYNYSYFGDGRERSVAAFGDASGSATSTYDANKVRTYVYLGQGDGQDRPEYKSMVIDNDGHIVYLYHDDGKSGTREIRDYAYANGNPVGETGQDVHGKKSVELDSGKYSLVLNLGDATPGSAITAYTTREGDTLQSIAAAVYGNPSLWFVIADANGLNLSDQIKPGTHLTIPNNIEQGLLTNDTHKLYNESEIVGSTLPNLKTPPPPNKGGCGNILMIIIIVVIAIVATIATAGLAGVFLGAAGTFLGLTGAAATIAAFAVAGAIVGALASIVQQGLFIALGYQEKFSWRQVASGAVSGAFSGAAQGLGAAARAGKLIADSVTYTKVASAALQVASVASKQLIENGKITSWTSLAGAALGGYASASKDIAAGQATIGAITKEAAEAATKAAQTLQTITSYATPWVQLAETYVRNDGKLTPADWAGAVGATLSSAVVDKFGVQGDAASQLQGQLTNAALRLGSNLLVAGALSRYDRDAAQAYMENAVGQEVGQLIGDTLGRSLQGFFDRLNDDSKQQKKLAQPDAETIVDPEKGAPTDEDGNPMTKEEAAAKESPRAEEEAKKAEQPQSVATVKKGQTLSQIISEKYGVGYDEELLLKIAAYNGISDPNLIRAGQELKLPDLYSGLLDRVRLSPELVANYKAGLKPTEVAAATPQEKAAVVSTELQLEGAKGQFVAPAGADAEDTQKSNRSSEALDRFKDEFKKGGVAALKTLSKVIGALEIEELVQLKEGIKSYIDELGVNVVREGGAFADLKLVGLGIVYASVETLFPTNVLDFIPGGKGASAGAKVAKSGEKLLVRELDDVGEAVVKLVKKDADDVVVAATKKTSRAELGFASTTDEMRKSVQGKEFFDPIENVTRLPRAGEKIQADHILPVAEIQKIDGFEKLTLEQQKAIVYDKVGVGNIQPLPASLNQSKGSKLDWSTYKGDPLPDSYVKALQADQARIRAELEKQINRMLGR